IGAILIGPGIASKPSGSAEGAIGLIGEMGAAGLGAGVAGFEGVARKSTEGREGVKLMGEPPKFPATGGVGGGAEVVVLRPGSAGAAGLGVGVTVRCGSGCFCAGACFGSGFEGPTLKISPWLFGSNGL